MKVRYWAFLLLLGCACGPSIPADADGGAAGDGGELPTEDDAEPNPGPAFIVTAQSVSGLSLLAVDPERSVAEPFGEPLPLDPDYTWSALYWDADHARAIAMASTDTDVRILVSEGGAPWRELVGRGDPVQSAWASEARSLVFLRYASDTADIDIVTLDDEQVHHLQTDQLVGRSATDAGPRDAYLLWTQRPHADAPYDYWRFDRRTGESRRIIEGIWSSRIAAFETSLVYAPAGSTAAWIDLDGNALDVPGFRAEGYLAGEALWYRDGVLELSDRAGAWFDGPVIEDDRARCVLPSTGYEVLADTDTLSWSGPTGSGTFESPSDSWVIQPRPWCAFDGPTKAIIFEVLLDSSTLPTRPTAETVRQRRYLWFIEDDPEPIQIGQRISGWDRGSPTQPTDDGVFAWIEEGQLRLMTPGALEPRPVELPPQTEVIAFTSH